MARVAAVKVEATRTSILDAARSVLRERGYASLSTREVAAVAGVPLSQIHYHFGSKQGMVLALFEYMNARLLERQNAMFADPGLTLSQQWDLACDYLDDDLATGYVRVVGKGSKERVVPLPAATREALDAYLEARRRPGLLAEPLFTSLRLSAASLATINFPVCLQGSLYFFAKSYHRRFPSTHNRALRGRMSCS